MPIAFKKNFLINKFYFFIRTTAILELMKTAYIFHDSFSDPISDWYPWMKETLEAAGYIVTVPKFPTPAGQSYESWRVVLKNYLGSFNGETIIIGHGTGGLFALRLVEELPIPLRGLFLVASYAEPLGNVGFDRLNQTFTNHEFNWDKIRSNSNTVRVFAGADDPFVPANISDHLGDLLKTDVQTIPDGGHLNKAFGFTQLVSVAQEIHQSLRAIDKSIEIETPVEETPLAIKNFPSISTNPSLEEITVERSPFAAHTMMEDMSQLMNSHQGSVASSILNEARNKEKEKKAASPSSSKNIFYIIATLFSVLIVIGIFVYLATKFLPATKNPVSAPIHSIIPAESHTKIDIIPSQPSFILKQSIEKAVVLDIPPENIQDIYYLNQGSRASFKDLAQGLFMTDLPDGLLDEFQLSDGTTPVFMHGTWNNQNISAHFLVIKMQNYDRAFTLMQQWEPFLFKDIGILMNVPQEILKARGTRDTFSEEIILNKNVRTLRSLETNDIILSYFFLDEHTVIITDRVEIIPELLHRWGNRRIY